MDAKNLIEEGEFRLSLFSFLLKNIPRQRDGSPAVEKNFPELSSAHTARKFFNAAFILPSKIFCRVELFYFEVVVHKFFLSAFPLIMSQNFSGHKQKPDSVI